MYTSCSRGFPFHEILWIAGFFHYRFGDRSIGPRISSTHCDIQRVKKPGHDNTIIIYINNNTEGSKSNIPCCALFVRQVRQHLRRIRGCDARIRRAREYGAFGKCYAQNSRTICAHVIKQMLRAPAAQQRMLLLDPSVYLSDVSEKAHIVGSSRISGKPLKKGTHGGGAASAS
jgi:hypothetical protein